MNEIEKMRKRLRQLDLMILQLISERMELSEEIGIEKLKKNIEPFQLDQYNLTRNFYEENGFNLGLSKNLTEELSELIHKESLRIQKELRRE